MLKKSAIVAVIAGLIYIFSGNNWLYADMDAGEEVITPHPLALYPGSVPVFDTDQQLLLTKDDVGLVKKFFETNKQDDDRVEPSNAENRQGYQVTFYKKVKDEEQSIQVLQFEENTPDTNMHPALGELKAQTVMGKHSEAEYQVLEEKYKNLHLAFFRQVLDDQGQSVSEGEKIYRKVYDQVHGKATSGAPNPQDQAMKAKGQDLKKQMQEMKAKGDMAGMMQLAQNFSKSPGQTKAGASAMAEMNKDTWDQWVTCLKDIEAVAYKTQLHYRVPPLP